MNGNSTLPAADAHAREIERLNRIYSTLSKLNRIFLHVKSRDELFEQVCRIAAEHAGFSLVWIGWENPETHEVTPMGKAGSGKGYLDEIIVYSDDRPEGRGPVGTCIREGRTCLFNDFLNNPCAAPWHERAAVHGLRAAVAVPIHFKGRVCGAFVVYSEEQNVFRDREISLLEEAAVDISFGLENLEREERRLAAEKAVRESQEELRAVFEELQHGLIVASPDGDIVDWNAAALRMHGFDSVNVSQKDLSKLREIFELATTDGRILPFEEWPLKRIARGETIRDLELRLKRLDYPWERVYNYAGGLVHKADGTPAFALLSFNDVTTRHHALESLKTSEEHLRAILLMAKDGFWLLDMKGRVLDANEASTVILGYGRDELLQMSIPQLEASESPDEVAAHFEMMKARGSDRFETRLKCKDGHIIAVEMSINYLDISGGRFVCFCRDISERKLAEDAMREALEIAQTAARMKSEFLANMSHEIRTPMNAVLGMAELISETELSGEQGEYLEIIKSSGSILLTLINDILEFSRMESVETALKHTSFDFRDFVKRTTNILRGRIEEKSIQFFCEIFDSVPAVIIGDDIRLGQLIMNLMGNAIKFSREGEFVMLIVLNESTPEDIAAGVAALHFGVVDSGIGIEPDQLSRIFEPFTQVDSSASRKYGGAGLGLAICRKLVDLMGGKLWVASKVGIGSAFHFTLRLPIGAAERRKIDTRPKEVIPPRAEGMSLRRVLLVEDNEVTQKLVVAVLGRIGIAVEIAENGQEAVDRLLGLKENPFDLVLMDIQMPVMNGFEATRIIRESEIPGAKRLPIIALTAHALHGDDVKCRRAGMDGYLSKPFSSVQLTAVVDRWISRDR